MSAMAGDGTGSEQLFLLALIAGWEGPRHRQNRAVSRAATWGFAGR
jgi:hypothetical protein